MTVHDRECMEGECRRARDEIIDTLCAESLPGDGFAVIHIETCVSCREWCADVAWLRGVCRELTGADDPSRLTADVLERHRIIKEGGGKRLEAADRRASGARAESSIAGRSILAVMVFLIVAFNVTLAFLLSGAARIVVPLAGVAVMLAPSLWAFADARKRGMSAAFWAVLQPFTVPVGLFVYLILRRGAVIGCPSCGVMLPGSARHCPRCGRKLRSVCCGCGATVREEYQICPRCGTILESCVEAEAAPVSSGRWNASELAFLIGVNAALLAAFLSFVHGASPAIATLAGIFYFLGWLPIVNWVLVDAKRRGAAYYAWGIAAVVTLYVGLIVYLAVRPDSPVACPACGARSRSGVNFCPRCGSFLRPACAECGSPAHEDDSYCSFCGERLSIPESFDTRTPR